MLTDAAAETLSTGTALGIAATIISALVALWVGTLKYAIASKDQETNRRFGEVNVEGAALRADVRNFNDRLHVEEKATIRQDGAIERVKDSHERVEKDIADIKERVEREMVTKSELHVMERTLREKLDELLRTQRAGYPPARPTPSPGRYGPSESPIPPKKDR